MKNELNIFGVPGTVTSARKSDTLWSKQKWTSERREGVDQWGGKIVMHAVIRFDDECGNGRNSFAVTGYGWYDRYKSRDWDFGGSCHVLIAKVFPELAPLIKWHSVFTDGPMHYVANTIYQASERDHNGLLKGEKRQRTARGGKGMWNLVADATGCNLKTALKPEDDITRVPIYRLEDLIVASECPTEVPRLYWEPCWTVGEGKTRDFDAARATAVWPEATDEQLSLPKEELKKLLEARLPALLEEFQADVKRTGLFWTPAEMEAAQSANGAGEIGD